MVKITKRGFMARKACPAHVREEARRVVNAWAEDPMMDGDILAELRPSAYIGNAEHSYTLSIRRGRDFQLYTISIQLDR